MKTVYLPKVVFEDNYSHGINTICRKTIIDEKAPQNWVEVASIDDTKALLKRANEQSLTVKSLQDSLLATKKALAASLKNIDEKNKFIEKCEKKIVEQADKLVLITSKIYRKIPTGNKNKK